MELLKISESALKVSLTREDMELYDIEFDMLDYSNIETRRVIWSILDEAKRTLGFETVRENIYIRAFRCMSGGCELFVCREAKENISQPRMFRFDNAELLIMACKRLENCGYGKESRLYAGDDGRFYLVLFCEGDTVFLDEVAVRVRYCEGYLGEHAKHVCSGAVKAMADLR